jgi:hypothetical protein
MSERRYVPPVADDATTPADLPYDSCNIYTHQVQMTDELLAMLTRVSLIVGRDDADDPCVLVAAVRLPDGGQPLELAEAVDADTTVPDDYGLIPLTREMIADWWAGGGLDLDGIIIRRDDGKAVVIRLRQ